MAIFGFLLHYKCFKPTLKLLISIKFLYGFYVQLGGRFVFEIGISNSANNFSVLLELISSARQLSNFAVKTSHASLIAHVSQKTQLMQQVEGFLYDICYMK